MHTHVDAHSKWPEVVTMSATTSQHTIDALRSLFSHYGLPEQLASDNGPQFTSAEFAQFLKDHGIKHILSAPYHPSSNGLAERFVRTFKRAMIAGENDGRRGREREGEGGREREGEGGRGREREGGRGRGREGEGGREREGGRGREREVLESANSHDT